MDPGASTSTASAVSTEQLEKANKDFAEAMDLRDSDPAAAVRLFDEVLRTRVAHYGEMAMEAAPVYMRYGMSLFEQAQMNQDYFGDKVQSAAAARDAAARGEDSDGSDSDDAAEEDNDEDGQPPKEPAEKAEGDSATAEPAAAADTAPTELAAAADTAPAEPPAAAENAQQPEDAEDADDMQVAWENLELARIIYEKHGGAEQHASDLAEIHNYTGDIFSEQEKFEEAIEEYNKCIHMLARLPREDHRRVAQVYFKQALAQQFNDQHQDALTAITTARSKLTAHRDALHKQLTDLPAPPTASNAAAAAFAAAVASFAPAATTPPPPPAAAAAGDSGSEGPVAPAGGTDADQAHEAAAKASRLRKQLGDINAVLEELVDKADELRAAIATQASMKDALRSAMRSLADAEQLAGEEGGAGAAGPSSSNGGPTAAGAVQDLGVVGKGRRVAPVPIPAATAAADGAGEDTSQKAAAAGAEGGEKEASPGAAGAGSGGAGKRSLEDVMGSGAAGGTTTVGLGGPVKSGGLEGAKVQQVKKMKPDAAGDGDQGTKPQEQQ